MEPEQFNVCILWRLTKDADITEGDAPVSSVKRILSELRDPKTSTKKKWNEMQV
jgi:hypothetical protein